MTKKSRKIIRIDEEKCDGCGLCLPGCPEGALQIIDGKARLVRESFCDGLGACLGHCPQGALQIEERVTEEYDAEGVLAHLEESSPELAERHRQHLRDHGLAKPEQDQGETVAVCPSCQVLCWNDNNVSQGGQVVKETEDKRGRAQQVRESFSMLRQWPVKLHLIPAAARFLKNAEMVFVADCVPFAYGGFHNDFLKGKVVAAGCPKFDDVEAYKEKIKEILENTNIKSIAVVYMEVSCCSVFVRIVMEALDKSGQDIPLETVMIGLKGEIVKREFVS